MIIMMIFNISMSHFYKVSFIPLFLELFNDETDLRVKVTVVFN
jgi:hypothetical protein